MSDYKRSPIPYMGNKYKLLKDLIPLYLKIEARKISI